MKVLKITEQEDGSAIMELDMSEEEKGILIQFAFVELLKRYIDENPPAPNLDNSECDEFTAEGTTRSHDEEDGI